MASSSVVQPFSKILQKAELSIDKGCKSEALNVTTASVICFCFSPSVDFHFRTVQDVELCKLGRSIC